MADGWGRRIEVALLLLASRRGQRVTLEQFGAEVALAEGRTEPYNKATVSGWIKERSEPTLANFAAIASVAGGDPWWYAFNVGRAPDNPLIEQLQPVPKPSPAKKRARGRR